MYNKDSIYRQLTIPLSYLLLQAPPHTANTPAYSEHPPSNSLQRLEVPMDDLLGVEVLHAGSDLPGPAHHLRGQDLDPRADVVVESAPAAVLQDHTVARGLRTNSPGGGGGNK